MFFYVLSIFLLCTVIPRPLYLNYLCFSLFFIIIIIILLIFRIILVSSHILNLLYFIHFCFIYCFISFLPVPFYSPLFSLFLDIKQVFFNSFFFLFLSYTLFSRIINLFSLFFFFSTHRISFNLLIPPRYH